MRKVESTTPLYNLGYYHYEQKYHSCKSNEELTGFLNKLIKISIQKENYILKNTAEQLLKYSSKNEIPVVVAKEKGGFSLTIEFLNIKLEHKSLDYLYMVLDDLKKDKVNYLIKSFEYEKARVLDQSVFKFINK